MKRFFPIRFMVEEFKNIDISFKKCQTNNDLMNLVNSVDLTLNQYCIAFTYLGLNIMKNHKDTNFLKNSGYLRMKEKINESLNSLSHEDIRRLLFFTKTIKSYSIPREFSNDTENKFVNKAISGLELFDDTKTVTDVYSSISVLKKVNAKLEAKVKKTLQSSPSNFSANDYIKLLNAAYCSLRRPARIIIHNACKNIELLDLQTLDTTSILNFMKILKQCDERFHIGHVLYKKMIDIVKARHNDLTIEHISSIFELYSNYKDNLSELLSLSMIELEVIVKEPFRFEMKKPLIQILESSAQLNFTKNNFFTKNLLEALIAKFKQMAENRIISHIEIASVLIYFSYHTEIIPPFFKSDEFFQVFKLEKSNMFWEIKIYEAFCYYRIPSPAFIMQNPTELIKNFRNSSFNIMLKVLISISNAHKVYPFSNNRSVACQISDEILVTILKRIVNWNDFKDFITRWETAECDAIEHDVLKPIYLKSIEILSGSFKINASWFVLKTMLNFFSEDPEILAAWTQTIQENQDHITELTLNHFILESYNIKHILPMIAMIKICPDPCKDSLAHVMSMIVRDLKEIEIKKIVEVLKLKPNTFVDSFDFKFKNSSVLGIVLHETKGKELENLYKMFMLNDD